MQAQQLGFRVKRYLPAGRLGANSVRMFRLFTLLGALFILQLPSALRAEVVVTFYSHDFGDHFPHALLVLKGKVDATGENVDTNYGFTAKNLTPAILTGSVLGMIETKSAKYIMDSDPHFSLTLNDSQFGQLMKLVEEWRNIPGKSYNLGKRNCVHFAMEAAVLLGLHVNRKSRFFKKPRSFLMELKQLNPALRL
jgi:hypothetical protein